MPARGATTTARCTSASGETSVRHPRSGQLCRRPAPCSTGSATILGSRLVVFTLDESTFSANLHRSPATTPRVFLGPPWWFLDSVEGMLRFRRLVTETAGFANTSGFVDDTRAFLSIPARHDVARRVDCRFLAQLVSHDRLELADAHQIAGDLTVGLPRRNFQPRPDDRCRTSLTATDRPRRTPTGPDYDRSARSRSWHRPSSASARSLGAHLAVYVDDLLAAGHERSRPSSACRSTTTTYPSARSNLQAGSYTLGIVDGDDHETSRDRLGPPTRSSTPRPSRAGCATALARARCRARHGDRDREGILLEPDRPEASTGPRCPTSHHDIAHPHQTPDTSPAISCLPLATGARATTPPVGPWSASTTFTANGNHSALAS